MNNDSQVYLYELYKYTTIWSAFSRVYQKHKAFWLEVLHYDMYIIKRIVNPYLFLSATDGSFPHASLERRQQPRR